MNMEKVLYEELLPCEFIDRINALPLAYLPLGTLEWHGRHLPLGSDGIQAKGVFEGLAKKAGGIVLPMLFLGPDTSIQKDNKFYYGMDIHSFNEENPQQLEGSAYYIKDDLFSSLLDTVMENLSRAGFKAVLGHGHGPSTKAFTERKKIFKDKFGLLTYNLWELGYEGKGGIQTDHAASNETSLVMALRPDLVKMEKLDEDPVPLAIWGQDPREGASFARGDEIIGNNIERAAKNIKSILSGLSSPNRELKYHDIKSLLED